MTQLEAAPTFSAGSLFERKASSITNPRLLAIGYWLLAIRDAKRRAGIFLDNRHSNAHKSLRFFANLNPRIRLWRHTPALDIGKRASKRGTL
jgi:hypothetical protein